MSVQPLGSSFRDPHGFLFRRDGVLYRQVNRAGGDDYARLRDSGLYDALTGSGQLLPHEEVDVGLAASDEAWRVIRPEPLPFIAYPYEWCFSQLQDAALLTLAIQRRALQAGMSLRDASAYNVQLRAGRPVFIDTLSFEAYREGLPWAAYRQFCQHFLAPLALMSEVDVRLGRLLQLHLDGVPLDLASALLPWRTRWRPSLGVHLHAHARSQRRHGGDAPPAAGRRAFSRRAFEGWIDSLEGAVRSLEWRSPAGPWRDYYKRQHNYGAAGLEDKERLVAAFLERLRPATVWDLGANVGRFSRLAADRGALTVAWDLDAACVEANYRMVRERGEERVLPLCLDLTNPSPALGWANAERLGFGERAPADAVLALGLVHHLAIGNNVPLGHLARFLARLGHHLIVEFVPKEDSQVARLLAAREDVFPDYTQQGFETALGEAFELVERAPIAATRRWLYRLRRRLTA